MKNQKNKGITLIALVITIVVLVILVGVSVSVAINTGLIQNSKTAVEDYDKAQTAEKSQLAEVEDIVAGYSSKDIMARKVIPANYGDTVTGYTVGEGEYAVSDWKIFSVEGNNVWLISKNGVKLDEETVATTGLTAEDLWDFGSDLVGWEQAPEFGKVGDNANCAASLADTSKWTKFVDEDLALKAMGAPTIEMFAKYYNDVNPTKKIEYKLVSTEDGEGYQVKWETDESFGVGVPSGINYQHNIWLASPHYTAPYNDEVLAFDGGTLVGGLFMTTDVFECHPVVCLKSDVVFTSSTTADGVTTWNLGTIEE